MIIEFTLNLFIECYGNRPPNITGPGLNYSLANDDTRVILPSEIKFPLHCPSWKLHSVREFDMELIA